jgi:putative thioredoxin
MIVAMPGFYAVPGFLVVGQVGKEYAIFLVFLSCSTFCWSILIKHTLYQSDICYNTWMLIFDTCLETFNSDVLDRSEEMPVLVDFWADWCAPCLVIAPVLERVLNDLNGAVRLAKLEVDEGENMKLAGHYLVRGFPTVILFQGRQELGRFSGARPAGWVRRFIGEHVDLAVSV